MAEEKKDYEIRLARYDEIEEIMEWIDTYWKKGHILANNRKIFENEFCVDGNVNIYIGREKDTGEIHGILGFLQASKEAECDVWTSIWKVRQDISTSLLGLKLKQALMKREGVRYNLCIGANPQTSVRIHKIIFGYHVDKMNHYYCMSQRQEYKIAKILHEVPLINNGGKSAVTIERLENIKSFKEFYPSMKKDVVPYKDCWYIQKHYYEHPVYQYLVYGLWDEQKNERGVLVCREQEYNGETALRIVDYLGEARLFGELSYFFEEKLKRYEYIDFYCYGFPEKYVEQAGMVKLEEDDTNVIPNYFSPYVCENIDIWIAEPNEKCTFFKADGDQDRPN